MMATLRPVIMPGVGILLVVHLRSHWYVLTCLSLRAQAGSRASVELGQRHPAGALQFGDAIGAQEVFEVVELLGVAGEHHGEVGGADVDDLALEHADQFDDRAPLSARCLTVAMQQLAFDGVGGVQLGDLDARGPA